jgi:hypothetical protein
MTCPLLSLELTTVVKIKRTLENAHTHKSESSNQIILVITTTTKPRIRTNLQK